MELEEHPVARPSVGDNFCDCQFGDFGVMDPLQQPEGANDRNEWSGGVVLRGFDDGWAGSIDARVQVQDLWPNARLERRAAHEKEQKSAEREEGSGHAWTSEALGMENFFLLRTESKFHAPVALHFEAERGY
jgi:hypothetical protein